MQAPRLIASLFVFACLAPSSFLISQENLPPEKLEYFETHIRPALVKYCYECHSEESGKTKGGLLLDTREGMLNGGSSGPLMEGVDGYPPLFLDAINHDDPDFEMPPKEKMPADVISKLTEWLKMGAPDPRLREQLIVESVIDLEDGRKHWAFQKPVRPEAEGIDVLIEAQLKSAELTPAEAADSLTLLRRLNFDLIGLPPTPGEARVFAAEWQKESTTTIEAKVDELMARPQFGERWGRHWLDVVRYAESSGNPNFTFPHAWRYRDYVIDAFNQDKPYDEFIREQIAGDLMPARNEDERQEQMIATGFLAVGIKSLNDRNPRTFQMNLIDEQIDTMSKAILGVTAACARCHDHKFDPIPTTDYYALAGIFMSTETLYGTIPGLQNHRPADLMVLPKVDHEKLGPSYSQEEIAKMREDIAKTNREIQEIRTAARKGGERPEQRQMVAMRNRISLLEGSLGSLNEDGTTKNYAMGVREADEITNANVLLRGDVEKPAQEVPRGFLQVLDSGETPSINDQASGRLELANWLASTENPLTARVIANRIWMHLLGKPIVDSPNNWGLTGQAPSHPELLDYLAISLMENGWSMKTLIREIVLTRTYQQSSAYDETDYSKDPDNRFLWRANPRQLDAESLRDSILAVSSNLDLSRPVASAVTEVGDARVGRQVDPLTFYDTNHRTVYLPVVRDVVAEPLALFNFADPNASSPKRDETNVPSQALFLMNNEFVTAQARDMATYLWTRFKNSDERITSAFLLAYGRPASADDLASTRQFFQEFIYEPVAQSSDSEAPAAARFTRGKGKGKGKGKGTGQPVAEPSKPLPPEQETFALFCQSLISSAEFRILN